MSGAEDRVSVTPDMMLTMVQNIIGASDEQGMLDVEDYLAVVIFTRGSDDHPVANIRGRIGKPEVVRMFRSTADRLERMLMEGLT